MTYGILSLASGNFLEAYASQDEALVAAARILHTEPAAWHSLALVELDDDGLPTDTLEGEELLHAAQEAAPGQVSPGAAAV